MLRLNDHGPRPSSSDAAWLHSFLLRREFSGSLLRRSLRPSSEQRPTGGAAEHLERLDANSFGVYAGRPHATLTGAFNYGALLQLRYGERERAEALCRRSIALCRLMIEEGRPAWWAEAMIEPYLNLGRLLAARGDIPAALTVYRDVLNLVLANQPTVIQGFVCDPTQIARSKQQGGSPAGDRLYQSAGASCLYDSFRALAAAGHPEQGFQLATAIWREWQRELAPLVTPTQLRELECLSFMLNADYSSALRVLGRLRQGAADDSLAIARALMTAEASFGNRDLAAGLDAGLEVLRYVSGLSATVPVRYVAYVLARLAGGRLAAGVDCSEQLARAALDAADRAGDHSLRLRCLIILSWSESHNGTGDRHWVSQLATSARHHTDRLETISALCELARRSNVSLDQAAHWTDAAILASRAGTVELETLSELIRLAASPVELSHDRPADVIWRFHSDWLEADFVTLMGYYTRLHPRLTTP